MDSVIYSELVGFRGKENIVSPNAGSLLILGCRTSKVPIGGRLASDIWDAQLYNGSVVPKKDQSGLINSVELVNGTLYVGSQLVLEPIAAMMSMNAPFPVVVTKGTVVAGSTGTHWMMWTSGTSLFVALLDPPPGKAVGTVELLDASTVPPRRFSLYVAETYVELVNGALGSDPEVKAIAKDEVVAKLVQDAKVRAALAGIRK